MFKKNSESGTTRFHGVYLHRLLLMALLLSLCPSSCSSLSLNTQGVALLRFRDRVSKDPFGALSNWKWNAQGDGGGGIIDPCSWFGIECSHGRVVILNLRDLHLQGTLGPELGKLTYLRSINLRNNSFSGCIPKEIAGLKELEILDVGYNNFSGPFPLEIMNNLSLTTLLLDSNEFLKTASPRTYEFNASWNSARHGSWSYRRLLQQQVEAPTPSISNEHRHKKRTSETSSSSPSHAPSSSATSISPSLSPSQLILPSISLPPESSVSPSPFPLSESQSPSPSPVVAPGPTLKVNSHAKPPVSGSSPPRGAELVPSPHLVSTPKTNLTTNSNSKQKHRVLIICAGVIGGLLIVLVSAVGFVYFRDSKVVTVKPWATGLSGQLQKAFITGVPKLNRSELEAACEDFSNIIGNLSDGTVYKGTLSSGVEIAVTSIAVASPQDWSKNLETQYRNKIDTLSKLNHKNFVNLIGYCEEEKPFTRMMVFEYAPNGTLFEHLHIKESEQLDWQMRLRIAMGMAYCLEYMHQLSPPIAHRNLNSSSIYLTEDYAAKISDFSFWNDLIAAKIGIGSHAMELLEAPSVDPESNVYSFGLILFEMITGRIPYSMDYGFVMSCLSNYLKGRQPSKKIVDPTLSSYQEDAVHKLFEVIKECIDPEPKKRPKMREITERLKEITAMEPEGATPKLSPLWWAELEIMSTGSSHE
ncbi:inactive receptor-like serine/threonine-protein kinase At2g40270 isoform X2 [Punica granatum]|uniref:Inactive receptor-like serine/threonine-protein kinase At2g40270 isoform X2 n=2 Tax=Punica granatum TaxID=22663 RepID=A0A218W1G9_PUNGR|nr:inactive receptor-like serine/threonine-protein kinase At2g40270 isoform X2 [Punica granatum]OWM66677.1 hypothetical protein CDL15_Pgr010328 [Punica granatum]